MSDVKNLEEIAKTFTLKSLPESEVELSGEIPFEALAPFEKKALEGLAKEIELPGFRKGHVPAEMARKKLGDIMILEEQVELFIRDFYPALALAHHVAAVGRPQIAITKLAPGNAVGITARTAVYPEVTLPKKWEEIGASVPLEPVIFENKPIDGELKVEDTAATTDSGTEIAGAKKETPAPKTPEEIERERARLEYVAKEKRRVKIIDALLAQTKMEVPKVFVESELEKMMRQLKDDIARFAAQSAQGGADVLSFDAYIKSIGKTEDDLREEFRAQALERAKLQLTLNKIAEEGKIEADPAAVEQELNHAKEHFPDARLDLLRIHIETVLRNEKILTMLEAGK